MTLTGKRQTIAEPLQLYEVPLELLAVYARLTSFITEKCGLSIRHCNPKTPIPRDQKWIETMVNQTTMLVMNNSSVIKELKNTLSFTQPDEVITLNGTKFPAEILHIMDLDMAASKICTECLMDPYGCCKYVGLDVCVEDHPKQSHHKTKLVSSVDSTAATGKLVTPSTLFVPLWACGWVCSDDSFNDREFKFVWIDPSLPEKASKELFEVVWVHSLIEACFWWPNDYRKPGGEESKKLISMVVTEALPLWPLRALKAIEALGVFEQHFEKGGTKEHNAVQCSCSKFVKTHDRSFLMQKVNRIAEALADGIVVGTGYNMVRRYLKKGPSVYLTAAINLIGERFLATMDGEL